MIVRNLQLKLFAALEWVCFSLGYIFGYGLRAWKDGKSYGSEDRNWYQKPAAPKPEPWRVLANRAIKAYLDKRRPNHGEVEQNLDYR